LSSLAPIGTPFIELLRVESTNNYAMGLVHEAMAQHGTAVFTHEQTRGKGQRNREWTSGKGLNIALSLVIEPRKLDPSRLFLLSMTMANGAFDFFSRHAGEGVKIKWPNDIYWRDRKAAGILIENVWQGSEWKYAVVGIGLNINQVDFGELGNRAVSLLQITGKKSEPVLLAKELCTDLERQFRHLLHQPSKIKEAYRSRLYKLKETVRLKKDNRIFEAVIKDVNETGQLVVKHSVEETFNVGDVEWVI
jgi:BirA family biotin operon repressor/biotin-[acetyl-CoA-carboxylase] ligase